MEDGEFGDTSGTWFVSLLNTCRNTQTYRTQVIELGKIHS